MCSVPGATAAAPPGFSCTMGMSFFRASSLSPMSALRSTPADDSITTAGRAAR